MDIIDIAILFDTQGILSAYPDRHRDFDEPGLVVGNKIFLITASNRAASGLGTGHLTIKCHPTETIRWRSLSLFGSGRNSASVYRISRCSKAAAVTENFAFLSRCTTVHPIVNFQRAADDDEPRFAQSSGLDFYFESPVPGYNTCDYKIQFYITEQDRGRGEPRIAGYFEWQPTITFAGFE
jgi:hypothetical protein